MSGTRRIAFWVVVAVQALLLVSLIGFNELALAKGDEVTLRTAPVDPIDLFRGNYVTLRYEISTLQVQDGLRPGDAVYVPLYESGGAWTGSFGYASPPPQGKFIRGTIHQADSHRTTIDYGIETYYADADEAERLQSAGTLLVTLRIDHGGRARISRVEPVR